MQKFLVFAGTRPEAIKVAPVVHELRARAGTQVTLVSSWQHKELLTQTLADFNLKPDVDLCVMRPNQDLGVLTARLFASITELLEKEKPHWVLVQGDTTTVFAAATCAFYRGCPVGHIEAGLRSFDMRAPFPEEFNRRAASLVADLHFAPTEKARQNLLNEHIQEDRIFVTGNTVIDSLLWMRNQAGVGAALLPESVRSALDSGKRLLLMTGHRRENHGRGFEHICQAITDLVQQHTDMIVVYPVHPNPNVRKPIQERLSGHDRILLLDPLEYKSVIALLDAAHIVLTDSGGIQEEAPALGKPVLVLRDVTERPEGVDAGTARLVGTVADTIVREVTHLWTSQDAYARMAHAINPYGDGQAARRIVDTLLEC